jgi:hypothetical protein
MWTASKSLPSLLAMAVVIFGLAVAFATTTHSTSELRPNLQVQPASELRIEYGQGGQKLLRFTTLGWNSGDGPLEVVADVVENGRQKVFQRVYDTSGGYTDHFAGFMDWHASHNHFHFNDYAKYTLRPASSNGQSERYGEKVTFCLMDTDRIDHRLAGAPKRAHYTSCGIQRQGISVGWGDAYRYYLDGQWIDITGLANGDYDLILELDPKGKIIETNDGDNTSTVRIRITGDTVEVLSGGGGNRGNRR